MRSGPPVGSPLCNTQASLLEATIGCLYVALTFDWWTRCACQLTTAVMERATQMNVAEIFIGVSDLTKYIPKPKTWRLGAEKVDGRWGVGVRAGGWGFRKGEAAAAPSLEQLGKCKFTHTLQTSQKLPIWKRSKPNMSRGGTWKFIAKTVKTKRYSQCLRPFIHLCSLGEWGASL